MITGLRFFVILSLGFSCWVKSSGSDFSCFFCDESPVVTNAARPAYPPVAVAKNIHGKVQVDVRIDSEGAVRQAAAVGGPSLLRKPAKDAAMRWQFNRAKTGSGMRSARLTFIFRPVSYVRKESESDFTSPYQMAVNWEGIAGSRQK